MNHALIAQAVALQKDGRHDAARALLLRMSAAEFDDIDLALLAARVAVEDLAQIEAFPPLARVLALSPDRGEALWTLGIAFDGIGKKSAAALWLDRYLRRQPGLATNHLIAAKCAMAAELSEMAARQAMMALVLSPDGAEAWYVLSQAAREFRAVAMMISAARRILALAPADVGFATGAAQILRLAGAFDAAIAAFLRAAVLAPHETPILAGFAQSLSDARRRRYDLKWHNRALALAPESPPIRINRAFRLLSAGDFAEGLREFEWRWRSAQLAPERRAHAVPFWNGEALAGKRLLIEYEQGFGDAIQMLRYIPLLAARGAEVVVEAPSALHRLLNGLRGLSGVVAVGENPGSLDFRCPAMSLPLVFETRLETIPGPIPYLAAEPQAVLRAKAKFAGLRRPLIGIVWSGDLRSAVPRNALVNMRRNLTPAQLAPILDLPAGFASLQFQARTEAFFDAAAHWRDFADAAADLMAVDALVTVDTAMAHLGGALGRPVFMLARYDTDWRWLDNRPDNPWYPTLRVFGQTAPGDWNGALAALRGALADFVTAFPAERPRPD